MKKPSATSVEKVLELIAIAEKNAKKGHEFKPLPKDAPFEDRVKFSLCKLFVRYLNENKMKAVDLALLLKLPKTRISDVLHYKIDNYSVDRLLAYALKLGEVDVDTNAHLNLVLTLFKASVKPVKVTKQMEKELLKFA